MDNIPEYESRQSLASERRFKAEKAQNACAIQIGELPTSQITETTSPVILGLYLTRYVERLYLEQLEDESREETPPPAAQSYRELTGDFHRILMSAKAGNFEPMKNFALDQAEGFMDMAIDALVDDDKETAQRYEKTAKNIKIAINKTPPSGDGSSLVIPRPAWMEEPIPLKIQLEHFLQGGDN